MNIRRRKTLTGAVFVSAAVVAGLLLVPSSHAKSSVSTASGRDVSAPAGGLGHALAVLPGSSPAAVTRALSNLTQSIPASDRPSCAPSSNPAFHTPAAQFPNGQQGLGVPFVAALTKGELLSGFHEGWTPGIKHPKYPWALSLTGITGWVTGLLEVPSLKTLVDPTSGIMFCDDAGLKPDPPASTPAMPRLHFTLIDDSNKRDNTQNYDPSGKQGAYAPYFFALKATGAPVLNVSSIAPDGAINLAGATPANTTVSFWTGSAQAYKLTSTCTQFPGTSIKIGSTATPEPASGPPNATLQFQPKALTGGFPSSTNGNPASATLVGNDFTVAAFNPAGTCGALGLILLNGPLSGFSKQGTTNYQNACTGLVCSHVASPPGWSQFTITATITTLDLPYGKPAGFGS
jgi:hypothetical protein